MLIVDIKINDKRIGLLKARRLNDVYVYEALGTDPIPCKYDVSYKKEDTGKTIKFELEHDYQDRAEVLIAKAMMKIKELEK